MSESVGVSGMFGSCLQPLAAVHDVALLDLDGVVYIGKGAVPHAAAALDSASAVHGMRSVFVTNNAARPPEVVAAHLVELGVRAAPGDVVTSAQAGARMLAERLPAGSRVLGIGGPGVPAALRERGLVPVESVDDEPVAVMQGFGPKVGWKQLAEGSLAIERGLVWVATNVDATIPSPRGRVLGNGSLVAALRHATGAEPLVAGKPLPPLMEESVERSQRAARSWSGTGSTRTSRGRTPLGSRRCWCSRGSPTGRTCSSWRRGSGLRISTSTCAGCSAAARRDGGAGRRRPGRSVRCHGGAGPGGS